MNPIPPLKTWLVAAVLVAIASGVQAENNEEATHRPSGPASAYACDAGPSQHAPDASSEDFPSFIDAAAGYALGEVWGRPVQDPRTRQLVAISAFLAQGSIDHLKTAARRALELGATEEQLREVVYLTLSRAGVASSADTAGVISEVLSDTKSRVLIE
ncbi:carboxymuconolactone decarboxylase family protein [Pseudoxanthomonas sp. UTMC 1351]|uniref:carboxymuconolactone decarboxylase family protein n=1 Tax=Pseudoxanthomonas sp. UTMC 1351 TaxID=2695853 RepID=UPI0034CE5DAF